MAIVALGQWLDSKILEVFSNQNYSDSMRDGKSTIRNAKDKYFYITKKMGIKYVLIGANKKINAGEILGAIQLLNLEKECRLKPSG